MSLGLPPSVGTDPRFGQIRLTGLAVVFARLKIWESRFKEAMLEGMRDWAKYVEREMQQNARWTDHTGHARQALRAYVSGDDPRVPSFATSSPPPVTKTKDDQVVIVTGFMDYNYWLETRWGGRFAIMWPTVVENDSRLIKFLVERGKRVT